MGLLYEERPSQHAAVSALWRGEVTAGSYIVPADGCWDIIWCTYGGRTSVFVSGVATAAHLVTLPIGTHLQGIRFHPSFRLQGLQPARTIDRRTELTNSALDYIWLDGTLFQIPHFDKLDQFVEQLCQHQLLLHNPIIHQTLQGEVPDVSLRTLQRHFAMSVGVPHMLFRRIERAAHAARLLAGGFSFGDVVTGTGFADQAHLTRELKQLQGVTPGQMLQP